MSEHLKFSAEQILPCPVEEVFAFFVNPGNLPYVMPRWQRGCIEEAMFAAPPLKETPRPCGPVAGDGSKIVISFRPLPWIPVRFRWEALIQDFVWNQGFCDLQLHGPFMFWRHCHTLTPVSEGSSCLLKDEISYELPFGPLNRLADVLFVRRMLYSMFRYRHRQTLDVLTQRQVSRSQEK